jgi:uncharacterized protein YutE (UPF0331/DUF86 family)
LESPQHLTMQKLSPKFDSIARCIQRIESKKPFSEKELAENFDLQDIVSTNVSRMIQLAVDVCTMILSRSPAPIPGDMSQCFLAVSALGWIDAGTAENMRRAVGLRNIMVHEYQSIDWGVVHQVTNHHLEDIKNFVRQVIETASKQT